MPDSRTFIAYRGHPNFELPQGHLLDFKPGADMGIATLTAGNARSTFAAIIDERPDRVTVKLVGEPVADDSPAPPYRFPWEPSPLDQAATG